MQQAGANTGLLVSAAGGLLVPLMATVLSIYRPCRLVESGVIHPFHRESVVQEAKVALQEDPIYVAEFGQDWRVLRSILNDEQCFKGEKAMRGVELRVTAEDALVRADAVYFSKLLDALKAAISDAKPLEVIANLTSALLTDLTDRGFSISNLYGFHKFFLAGNVDPHGNERTFDDRFNYLLQWLQRPRQKHEVVLRLSRANKLAALEKFSAWEFSDSVTVIESTNSAEMAFTRQGMQVVFAKTTVEARDYREAGATALRAWFSVSDQLLFDFIPQTLPYDAKYRSVRVSDGRMNIGILQETIPNPRDAASERHLREFSQQLEIVLSSKCRLRDEDKRQLEAAMR